MSLDSILHKISDEFKNINLIKIDTDGHDFEVLRGAIKTIRKHQPAVFFECDVFSNPCYIEDVLEIVSALRDCGYRRFLVYENKGCLLTRLSVNDTEALEDLLRYQLTSKFGYYDFLFLTDDKFTDFARSEKEFFQNVLKK